MKPKLKLIALIVGAMLVAAGAAAGGVAWWMSASGAPQGEAEAAEDKPAAEDTKPGPDYKYVTLEKVLVMLRGDAGSSVAHYLAIDVVFKVLPEHDKRTKEHLPLLRTVAVKTLSAYTVERARAMTVPDFAAALNTAYREAYAAERREAPFAEALIGKLIIE